MRASYKWLKELLPDIPDYKKVGDILTMTGAELEGLEFWNETLKDVVCVKIIDVIPNTPREGLSKCIVTDGDKEYTTLSGAPFIEKDMLAAYAKPGGIISGNRAIGERTIHDELSQGMLLSGCEMGFSEPAEKLFYIPPETPIGADLLELLGWKDEVVFELELTPNRPDLLGHLGLARDIAAALDIELIDRIPEIDSKFYGDTRKIEVLVDIPEDCPRYSGIVIENLNVGPSPLWLQGRLNALDIRPISNIVDVTNYILMYVPHPLHAFDLDELKSDKIIVRHAESNEKFVTLDDEERKLKIEDIVISTPDKAVALGGVMGGKNTEVSENTKAILLEAACFNSMTIRSTSTRLMLRSESSHRFERGMDPNRCHRALIEASSLISQVTDCVISKDIADSYPMPYEKRELTVSNEKIERVLGIVVDENETIRILKELELEHVKTDNGVHTFKVPTYRPDLEREIDLVEEVARIYGYEHIPEKFVNSGPLPKTISPIWSKKFVLYDRLRGFGALPILGNAIDSYKNVSFFADENELVPLKNPMSEDNTHMRPSILPALLQAVSTNKRQQAESMFFFECDKVYKYKDNYPEESYNFSIAMAGNVSEKNWYNNAAEAFDIYHAKGLVEDIAEYFKLNIEFDEDDYSFYKKGESVTIKANGKKFGYFGRIEDKVANHFDIKVPVYAIELDFTMMIALLGDVVHMEQWSRYPSTSRDIALIVDKNVPAGDMLDFAKSKDYALLTDTRIFDHYDKKPIPKGKKSIGLKMTYHSDERTLTDEEVDTIQNELANELVKKFSAEIRDK